MNEKSATKEHAPDLEHIAEPCHGPLAASASNASTRGWSIGASCGVATLAQTVWLAGQGARSSVLAPSSTARSP